MTPQVFNLKKKTEWILDIDVSSVYTYTNTYTSASIPKDISFKNKVDHTIYVAKRYFKVLGTGVPGWLSWLSICLQLRS